MVCSNIELNGTVLKAKQDTGAQINVLSKSVPGFTEGLPTTIVPQDLCEASRLWKQSYQLLGHNQNQM